MAIAGQRRIVAKRPPKSVNGVSSAITNTNTNTNTSSSNNNTTNNNTVDLVGSRLYYVCVFIDMG